MSPSLTAVPSESLLIHRLVRQDLRASFGEDVKRGLGSTRKHLFPRYLYDELGSQLFEAICLVPEYYLTRAENEILMRFADEITGWVEGSRVVLLEMGSGSAIKTRLIIEAFLKHDVDLLYMPVDISPATLETSARVLMQCYPSLRITGYASDYDTALARLREASEPRERTLALFLGSNIGNFEPGEAELFLRTLRTVLKPGDALLLGADLKKDSSVLEAAYDDTLGITAAFSRNLLGRLNREFSADFDVGAFRHVAIYNEQAGRIEVYLESMMQQVVRIRDLGLNLEFMPGERIHIENSYKYDIPQLSRMASSAGFTLARSWFDEAGYFSSNLFTVTEE